MAASAGVVAVVQRIHVTVIVLVGLLAWSTTPGLAAKDDDLITNLPGLTFNPNFKQYSGYLPTATGNLLHYW